MAPAVIAMPSRSFLFSGVMTAGAMKPCRKWLALTTSS